MPRAPTRGHRHPAAAVLLAAAFALPLAAVAQEKDRERASGQAAGEARQPRGAWRPARASREAGEIQRIEERCQRRLVVAADSLFAFDRDELTPQADTVLAKLGPQIAEAKGKVTIEGHTDGVGPDDYNRALSERRARAVRDWLARRGFTAANTSIAGLGESKPVAANTHPDGSDDPEARRKNRRVEVVVETCPRG